VLAGLPLPVFLLIVSFALPTEFSIPIGGMRFAPHRIVLLFAIPFAVIRMLQPGIRLRAFDFAFLFYNAWMFGVFLYHGDTQLSDGYNANSSGALAYGGALALEGFGGYIVARAFVRDSQTALAALRLLIIVIAGVALLALPEALSGVHFGHDLASLLSGNQISLKYEKRMGLERAYATFDHPILFGAFCASVLAMVWMSEPDPRWRKRAIMFILLGSFLSLSSAPMLSLGLQAALLVWERATRGMASRLSLTFSVLFGLMIGFWAVTGRSPAAFVATGMTLDSWTGYYRLLIWEFGIANVMDSPWTGIGLRDWTRPYWMASDSIDAFWLVIPLRAGLPASVFLVCGITLVMLAASRKISRRGEPQVWNFRAGWIISLIAFGLIGCTVHYWNALYCYVFFIIGLGTWIADPRRVRVRARSLRPPVRQPVIGAVGARA
jgi:hypothetical protein